jgi:site-specific recombinase XerC
MSALVNTYLAALRQQNKSTYTLREYARELGHLVADHDQDVMTSSGVGVSRWVM